MRERLNLFHPTERAQPTEPSEVTSRVGHHAYDKRGSERPGCVARSLAAARCELAGESPDPEEHPRTCNAGKRK